MSDTPRTDAIQLSGGGAATLMAGYYLLCCELERDLAAAKEQLVGCIEIREAQDKELAAAKKEQK